MIFGTADAVIDKENSNSTVLKVTVPYYEEEEPVTITLVYRYRAEDNVAEGRRSESADKFAAKKVQPENVECPAKIMLGDEFDITGTNLEKVLFNETEITAMLSDDKTKLTCSLPGTVTKASTGNKISIKFWQGNGVKEIRNDFAVKVLANYIRKNVKLYASKDSKNYYSVTTDENYTSENYTEVQNSLLLLTLNASGSATHATNNMNQIAGFYSNTATPRTGIPLYFRGLGRGTDIEGNEQGVIDFIKNGDVEDIPITMEKMKELGYDDSNVKNAKGAREATVIRYKLNDNDYNAGISGNGYFEATEEGRISAVIIRKSNKGDEDCSVLGIGFVELVKVDRGDTTQNPLGDATTASWTVNLYFPKDILKNINQVIR